MKMLRISAGPYGNRDVLFEQPLRDAREMIAVAVDVLLGNTNSVSAGLHDGRGLEAEIIDVPKKKK